MQQHYKQYFQKNHCGGGSVTCQCPGAWFGDEFELTSFLFLKVLFTSKVRWIDVCPSPAQLHFKGSELFVPFQLQVTSLVFQDFWVY